MKLENKEYIEALKLWVKEQELLIRLNTVENRCALQRVYIDKQLIKLRDKQNEHLGLRVATATDEINKLTEP